MNIPNFAMVIFGVTSNLAQLKLLPALYDLEERKIFSETAKIVCIGRKPFDHQQFVAYVREVLNQENRHHQHEIKEEIWNRLQQKLTYLQGDFSDPQLYAQLVDQLNHLQIHNRIFYLATYPSLYQNIFDQLQVQGLNQQTEGWTRLMVEKPIGNDLQSAKELDQLLNKYFAETQVYRLDHYLGKETLQNILTFRFGNGLFEPLLNNKYVDHIQITVAEDFGIGQRGGYFDSVGDLKDMGQNHLLQMLTAVTMETPAEFSNPAVTRERVKTLSQLVPMPDQVVFGQYEGYQSEAHVSPGSQTDTFFALKTELKNDRFAGVPIYMRSGKKLARTVAEISVIFKNPTNRLFKNLDCGDDPNVLIFRIQPSEGIVLRILSKTPGHEQKLEQTYMQFCYRQLSNQLTDPYEHLIADTIAGDQTFFNDAVEVEAQWAFIDPLFARRGQPIIYQPGSWGPEEADELLKRDGRAWLEPSTAFCAL